MQLPAWISALASRTGSAAGAIGLDLDRDRLHLVQLERGAHGPRIRAAHSAPFESDLEALLADPRAFGAFLRRAREGHGFRGRRVVSVLPDDTVKLMVLNYEDDPQRSDPELILGLVQERIDGPIEDCVVDYLPLRTAEKHGARAALAAVARREDVITHLELLRAAGLEVLALEIAPVAVRRLVVQLSGADVTHNSLVIHCGAQRSHLTILAGRRLILYREIDYGEEQALETLCKSLDMTPEAAAETLWSYGVAAEQAGDRAWDDPAAAREISETVTEILKPGLYGLVEQVEMAAVYTASEWHGASVDQLLLLGRLARWPGIAHLLTTLASIPASVVDPLAQISGGAEAEEQGAQREVGAAVATGLALRGMADDG